MAASTNYTSSYVSSYSDKTDEWVRARLEFLDNNERISSKGSIPRRKEIRQLRVELLTRQKAAAQLAAAQGGAAPTSLVSPVMSPQPAHPVRR
jgi:hypothetical protein